jgi:hypothetical protein
VARFDVYRNPNPRASHGLLLDVQSDLVRTHTRWCVPLLRAEPATAVKTGAQLLLTVTAESWLLDTPNILAVPSLLLRAPVVRLTGPDQLQVESALDFMLRGW